MLADEERHGLTFSKYWQAAPEAVTEGGLDTICSTNGLGKHCIGRCTSLRLATQRSSTFTFMVFVALPGVQD